MKRRLWVQATVVVNGEPSSEEQRSVNEQQRPEPSVPANPYGGMPVPPLGSPPQRPDASSSPPWVDLGDVSQLVVEASGGTLGATSEYVLSSMDRALACLAKAAEALYNARRMWKRRGWLFDLKWMR